MSAIVQTAIRLMCCPFCGSESTVVKAVSIGDSWGECLNCGANGPIVKPSKSYRLPTADEAADLWNKRA